MLWRHRETEWSYSSTLSLTLTQGGDEWSMPRPAALPPVKRHSTRCSSVSSVVFGNGLDGYGKSRLNWHSNAESCSTQTVAMPNTLPRPPIFGAVSNKSSYYSVDCLLSEHSCVIRFGLPPLLNLCCHLSLCQIYDYILNCHVSFMKWSNLYLFKLWAFRIISEDIKQRAACHYAWPIK